MVASAETYREADNTAICRCQLSTTAKVQTLPEVSWGRRVLVVGRQQLLWQVATAWTEHSSVVGSELLAVSTHSLMSSHSMSNQPESTQALQTSFNADALFITAQSLRQFTQFNAEFRNNCHSKCTTSRGGFDPRTSHTTVRYVTTADRPPIPPGWTNPARS